jgi:hypothetical protein
MFIAYVPFDFEPNPDMIKYGWEVIQYQFRERYGIGPIEIAINRINDSWIMVGTSHPLKCKLK